MKNCLMFLVLFAALTVVLPVKTFAQYYNTYMNGAILNHALASQRAAALRAKARHNKQSRKRVARKSNKHAMKRKSRRVSMLENIICPKLKLNSDLPKRIEIA